MELFVVIALSAIVLLLGVCAYCLSFAVSRNANTPETAYLHAVSRLVRKLVIVGGIVFLVFVAWSVIILTASTFQ